MLDEDGDTLIFGEPILALRDEIDARGSLRPFVPGHAQADSHTGKGQFGPAG